jgi:NAD(P)H-dependent flavin oxidoreductase YrpB (nitropropane dioxygenase family)
VSALCGARDQALKHKAAGVDIIIAQGTEGGGHTGEIGSMVLWPEVIDAVAPTPVLAAGGIGRGRQIAAALGMGAQGVWTGSIWLAVEEAEASPEQMESYLARQPRHRALALVDRQAGRYAQERLDRGVGVAESPGYARHAAPGHARVGGDVARAPLPKAAQKVAFNRSARSSAR